MARKPRKKSVSTSDRQGTKRFFTVAGITTLVLLALMYLIYSMN